MRDLSSGRKLYKTCVFAALSSRDVNSAQHIVQLMLQADIDIPNDFLLQVRAEEQRILHAAEEEEETEEAQGELADAQGEQISG